MAAAALWTGGSPTFVRHRVGNLYTVAHLFSKAQRCGVYVLTFKNGERYVGQSVNVVGRFAAHRRTWTDIDDISFCRCPAKRLDELERLMIASERASRRLRNVTHALGPLGDSDLDPIVAPAEQLAWLNDDTALGESPYRADDPIQRQLHQHKFTELRELDAFSAVVAALSYYVQNSIPRPVETERTFWSLSAAPATKRRRDWRRLAAICINKMETFFIGEMLVDGEPVLAFYLNVSHRSIVTSFGSLGNFRLHFPFVIAEAEPGYESAGGDCLSLRFLAREAPDVLSHPGVLHAARALNLMLMRKGPTLQWRWHNYALADWVIQPARDAAGAAPRAPTAGRRP